MLVYHDVLGSKETSFHNFEITTSGMDLVISAGEYQQAGEQKFVSEQGATVSIPSPSSDISYQVWLTETGIQVIYENDTTEFAEVTNPIDRLAWCVIPANTTTLDNVEINVMRTIEEVPDESTN